MIENNYSGESFSKGYYQDLMEKKNEIFIPSSKIPLGKKTILELIQNCNIESHKDQYLHSFDFAAIKARLYPMKLELLSIKKELEASRFENKFELYKSVLERLIRELRRLGLDDINIELINHFEFIDEILDEISNILTSLIKTFQKHEISFDIIDEIVRLL